MEVSVLHNFTSSLHQFFFGGGLCVNVPELQTRRRTVSRHLGTGRGGERAWGGGGGGEVARDGEAVGGGGTVDLKRQTRASKRQRRTEIRI